MTTDTSGGDDIRSDLTAAFDAATPAAQSPDAAQPAAPSPEPSAKAASPASDPAKDAPAKAGAGPARDASGKFATSSTTPNDKAAPDGVADPAAAKPAIEPLHHWPEDQKALIRNLAAINPEMAQQAFARFKQVDDAFAQKSEGLKPLRVLGESIEPLLAKGRQQRAMAGISDAQYLQQVLNVAEYLDRDPAGTIRHLATQYGIDLTAPQQGQAEGALPPQLQHLVNKVQQLEQSLTGVQQQTQQEQQAAAMAQLEAFAYEKDANGVPLRPYFNELMSEIGMNIQFQRQNGQAPNLQAAYDKATRMNDEVWQRIQSEKAEAQRKAAEAKRAQEVAEAKRAGFSVTGSGANTNNEPADTLREELLRQFDRQAA